MHPNWITPFLKALASGSTVSEASAAARISSSTAYHLRREDADFAEAWRLALEDSTDVLEAEARRRAVDGTPEPVIYQGQPTYVYETDERGETVQDMVQVEYVAPDGTHGLRDVILPRKKLDANGQPVVLTVAKKSDALLALLLKGRRKDIFADRTELTGANGEPVEMIDRTKRASRIAALMALARGRKEYEDIA